MGNVLEPFTNETELNDKLMKSSDFLRVYINGTTKILSDKRTSKKLAHITTTNIEKKLRKNAKSLQIVHEDGLPFIIGYVYSNAKNEFAHKMHTVRAPMEKKDRSVSKIESPQMERLHYIVLYVPTNSRKSYRTFPGDVYKVLEDQKDVISQKLNVEVSKLNNQKVKKQQDRVKIENEIKKELGVKEGFIHKEKKMVWGADGSIQLIK